MPPGRCRSSTSRRSRRASPPICGAGSMRCWRIASSSLAPRFLNSSSGCAAFCGAAHCVAVSLRHRRVADRADGGGHRAAATRCSCPPSPTPRPPKCRCCWARRRCSSMSIRGPSRSTRRILRRGSPRCGRAGKLRPRALIGVDLFGQPADWPALREIAQRGGICSRSTTARRVLAPRCTASGSGARRMRRRSASSPRSRSAPMATAARCSPRAPTAPRCIAACARTARAARATRCCAPA